MLKVVLLGRGEVVDVVVCQAEDEHVLARSTRLHHLLGDATSELAFDKSISLPADNADEDGSGDVSEGDTLTYTIVTPKSSNRSSVPSFAPWGPTSRPRLPSWKSRGAMPERPSSAPAAEARPGIGTQAVRPLPKPG